MSPWLNFVDRWKDCQLCPLGAQRGRIVLARGTVPCDVCFIGEAPGASEDARGIPFDGPAGGILDQIIERALPPTVTYILTNLVCCFPREAKARGENEPEHSEILSCKPRLIEFVNIAQPKLIVCVGSLAAEYVDHSDTVRCIDIIHPAATFPPRMPRVQAGMAIQHAIVKLRNAVEDMIQVGPVNFTKWGASYAGIKTQTPRERLRSEYDAAAQRAAEAGIPF